MNAADIGKRGSCHLFRHTMATLMLENGADIRYIQAMLGPCQAGNTQIYTQVSIRKLKEIHTATPPGPQGSFAEQKSRPSPNPRMPSGPQGSSPKESGQAGALNSHRPQGIARSLAMTTTL